MSRYAHLYPWQLATRLKRVALTARLAPRYPVDVLQAELAAVLAHYQPREQFGYYHRGGWSGVALRAVDGDPFADAHVPGGVFSKTPALQHAPCMEEIIGSFPCEVRRVRLLRLAPGQAVYWHTDKFCSVDARILRLHIPLVTNERVAFQVSHEDCSWQPGELWYADFSFPHRLRNDGVHGRVHLVLDLVANDATRAMLPDAMLAQRELRTVARERCNTLMWRWEQLFKTEKRLVAAQARRLADHGEG